MRLPRGWFIVPVLLAVLLAACGGSSPSATAPTSEPQPDVPPTPAASPTPSVIRQDILASRLVIPALNIDAEVQVSRSIPYVDAPMAGCPGRPGGTTTLTVPDQGIATPEDSLDGLENKAWIFGHSRWLGRPGLLFTIQDLNPGDEVIIDGTDRATGEPVRDKRFVVRDLYLTDIDSADLIVNNPEIPARPTVILQTSVRASGPGQQWILDRAKLTAKATNLVEGDINDPCKYLLLFVVAEAS